ncbi:hypothetical protein ABK040_009319 [Willaertia magna]
MNKSLESTTLFGSRSFPAGSKTNKDQEIISSNNTKQQQQDKTTSSPENQENDPKLSTNNKFSNLLANFEKNKELSETLNNRAVTARQKRATFIKENNITIDNNINKDRKNTSALVKNRISSFENVAMPYSPSTSPTSTTTMKLSPKTTTTTTINKNNNTTTASTSTPPIIIKPEEKQISSSSSPSTNTTTSNSTSSPQIKKNKFSVFQNIMNRKKQPSFLTSNTSEDSMSCLTEGIVEQQQNSKTNLDQKVIVNNNRSPSPNSNNSNKIIPNANNNSGGVSNNQKDQELLDEMTMSYINQFNESLKVTKNNKKFIIENLKKTSYNKDPLNLNGYIRDRNLFGEVILNKLYQGESNNLPGATFLLVNTFKPVGVLLNENTKQQNNNSKLNKNGSRDSTPRKFVKKENIIAEWLKSVIWIREEYCLMNNNIENVNLLEFTGNELFTALQDVLPSNELSSFMMEIYYLTIELGLITKLDDSSVNDNNHQSTMTSTAEEESFESSLQNSNFLLNIENFGKIAQPSLEEVGQNFLTKIQNKSFLLSDSSENRENQEGLIMDQSDELKQHSSDNTSNASMGGSSRSNSSTREQGEDDNNVKEEVIIDNDSNSIDKKIIIGEKSLDELKKTLNTHHKYGYMTPLEIIEFGLRYGFEDEDFVSIVSVTYSTFTSIHALIPSIQTVMLALLRDEKIPHPVEEEEENEQLNEEIFKLTNEEKNQVIGRVTNVLKQFVTIAFYDFQYDKQVHESLYSFVGSLSGYVIDGAENTNKIREKVFELFERITLIISDAHDDRIVEVTIPPPKPIISDKTSNDPRKINLLEIDPMEIARQLTLFEYGYFEKITSKELLGASWMKDTKEWTAPNITQLIARSNILTNWVTTYILKTTNIKDRKKILKHFILIADCCLSIHNYNTVFEIAMGLISQPIYRLKKTWEILKEGDLGKKWKKLEEITSFGQNRKNYREQIKKVIKNSVEERLPCLPYLGIHLSDLVFLDEGNVDKRESPLGLITQYNFTKRALMGQIVHQIISCKRIPYNFEKVDLIEQFIWWQLNSNVIQSEDELFKLSKSCER